MNKRDILNRLFVENNLTEEDVFKHQHYTIITRAGIDKIQANIDISIDYEVIKCDTHFAVVKPNAAEVFSPFEFTRGFFEKAK